LFVFNRLAGEVGSPCKSLISLEKIKSFLFSMSYAEKFILKVGPRVFWRFWCNLEFGLILNYLGQVV